MASALALFLGSKGGSSASANGLWLKKNNTLTKSTFKKFSSIFDSVQYLKGGFCQLLIGIINQVGLIWNKFCFKNFSPSEALTEKTKLFLGR